MAKAMAVKSPEHIETITIKDSLVKGIAKHKVDDTLQIVLQIKIIGVSRDTWEKNKPLEARAQILSGRLSDSKAMKGIKAAKTVKELEEAAKEE